MTISAQYEMFQTVLKLMADGEKRTRKEVFERVATSLNLTSEEQAEKTGSGKLVYQSRADWSITYLTRARYLDRVKRGTYRINDSGLEALKEGLSDDEFWHMLTARIRDVDPWQKGADSVSSDTGVALEEAQTLSESPQECIFTLVGELNSSLANELLASIMEHNPAFFEKVVVDLLEAMGYGKGEVTQHSNDYGIDGLITTDELGFRPICTQAKRYAAERKVNRSEVQAFVGALNGAANGVFITTSSFTKEAIEYAENYSNATLALIDGERLTKLMVRYGLGVTIERVVEIKRIDSDYFEE